MKKSLVVVTLAIACSIALSGCSKPSSASGDGTLAVPSSTATSSAQVKSLNDAVAYALTITPKTPDALSEIGQTDKLLKQFADSSSKLSADQKSAADGFVAQSQQAVAAGDVTSAGADLEAAAQGVAQALAGD
jgi:hypothetical protein